MSDYTIKRLEEVDDVLGDYPGEMRMLTEGLEAEQVAFTYRRMPQHTGGKGSYGHRHKEQEEIYFVASGKLQFKLGDDVVDVSSRNRGAGAPGDLALGLERRAGGRGADHRLQARRGRLGRGRRVPARLLARVAGQAKPRAVSARASSSRPRSAAATARGRPGRADLPRRDRVLPDAGVEVLVLAPRCPQTPSSSASSRSREGPPAGSHAPCPCDRRAGRRASG